MDEKEQVWHETPLPVTLKDINNVMIYKHAKDLSVNCAKTYWSIDFKWKFVCSYLLPNADDILKDRRSVGG